MLWIGTQGRELVEMAHVTGLTISNRSQPLAGLSSRRRSERKALLPWLSHTVGVLQGHAHHLSSACCRWSSGLWCGRTYCCWHMQPA